MLARNLNRMAKVFPQEYAFFPPTWVLPAEYTQSFPPTTSLIISHPPSLILQSTDRRLYMHNVFDWSVHVYVLHKLIVMDGNVRL